MTYALDSTILADSKIISHVKNKQQMTKLSKTNFL